MLLASTDDIAGDRGRGRREERGERKEERGERKEEREERREKREERREEWEVKVTILCQPTIFGL
ncbi:hypothetical protein J5X98_21640 [Leptothermofonsia sichuanensis E412]|uniref:hypothetical protein n=1 Tax=Leptothermofonsia sichuanensis TaxID=2917832 RepID=UPI001CA75284|nr:hypothetical protein [Leptothermofonsia sichuanensis]QZZ19882.1 hypothetical protein J5X98_21640 [Leptothermofonsia sichuanensis E412]